MKGLTDILETLRQSLTNLKTAFAKLKSILCNSGKLVIDALIWFCKNILEPLSEFVKPVLPKLLDCSHHIRLKRLNKVRAFTLSPKIWGLER
jgi:hypothetical protein